jgi:hypothetical protein
MRLTVFNGSPRGKKSNSKIVLDHFLEGYDTKADNSYELFYLNRLKDTEQFVEVFAEAEHLLLVHPLYTDAMPGMVMSFIEALEPLCGQMGDVDIGFIVQSGFGEAAHSRYVARYHKKLAARLGYPYLGTVIKGNCEPLRLKPQSYRKILEDFRQLGQAFGETGHFDEALVRKLAGPEKFSTGMRLLIQLVPKIIGNPLWDDQLKENGVYERRFDRPYRPPTTDN